jgi:aspartate aminotransferase
MATLNPGDEVIIRGPTGQLSRNGGVCGGTSVFADTSIDNGFKLTAAVLERAITPRPMADELAVEPVGRCLHGRELRALASEHSDVWVLTDDMYDI